MYGGVRDEADSNLDLFSDAIVYLSVSIFVQKFRTYRIIEFN